MKIELNIGLERSDDVDGLTPLRTYRKALETLRKAVDITYDRTYVTTYEQGEIRTELGLFVAFEWKATAKEFFTFIGLLSVDLGQDCIAAYSPDTNGGALIGPKATEWGFFNKTFFKRFNEAGEEIA